MAHLKAEAQRRALFTRDRHLLGARVALDLRVITLEVLRLRGESDGRLTPAEVDALRRLADGDLEVLKLVGHAGAAATPESARRWLQRFEAQSA